MNSYLTRHYTTDEKTIVAIQKILLAENSASYEKGASVFIPLLEFLAELCRPFGCVQLDRTAHHSAKYGSYTTMSRALPICYNRCKFITCASLPSGF